MSYLTRRTLLAWLLVGQAAALATCHQCPQPTAAPAAAETQARRDSARGAHLATAAAGSYAQGRAAQDSATFYYLQTTHVQATSPGDTAALRRFFATYPY